MATRYDITGQRPSSRVSPTMQIERTYEVTFVTKPSGITGVAEIPVSQYTPQTVHDTVDALALNLEGIQAL